MMLAGQLEKLSRVVERGRERMAALSRDYGPVVRRQVLEREWLQFIAASTLVLAVFMLVRPLLAAPTADDVYHAPVVFLEIADREIESLRQSIRAGRPGAPAYLFPLIPTILLLAARKKIRWEMWEAGRAFRWLVMSIVLVLMWAGATFDYNMYLDRGHFLDRLLLVALALIAWKRPLAIPFFATQAVVMMREANPPLGHDDFDWRPVTELLILFSCFAWLSFLRGIRTRHYVLLALCLFGSYYYQAGVSKLFYGETGSWVTQNRLSNLFVSSYEHGWLGFLPEGTFVAIAKLSRYMDVPNAVFTLAIAEIGAIALLFLHPRLARFWLLSAALLHVGIFAFSGIFFWKWIAVDLIFWHFLRRAGAEVHAQIFKSKLIPLYGAALIFFSEGKTYLNPQIGVSWWDSNLNESYHLHAVGTSGKSWPVHPRLFAPYDARTMQEDWCFLTQKKRLTAIYGTTGSYEVFKELEAAKNEADVERVVARRGWSCFNQERKNAYDNFVASFFSNLNRNGGRKHRWLSAIGRPDHIWAQRQTDDYAYQEPVRKVEVWRQRMLWDGSTIQRFEPEKIHEIPVP